MEGIPPSFVVPGNDGASAAERVLALAAARRPAGSVSRAYSHVLVQARQAMVFQTEDDTKFLTGGR